MRGTYNGGLTREQFLFYEIRIVAALKISGLSDKEIEQKIEEENLFQFPTERMIQSILKTCLKRISAIDSDTLVELLATGPIEVAKQINLYAMMKYNRVVWDFMQTVIAEKFRTRDFTFSKKDMNVFFYRLQEQDDEVATWRDATVQKIKQVLIRSLVECDFLDSTKSEQLNPVCITPELEDELRQKNETAALAAFNCLM